jgi:ectoine hydroxylase-related dioxygenase (phytanoyl-CoA dioxygenase family)
MHACCAWCVVALQVPHQDSTFLYTDPPSCVGLWLALEDATRANGCLWGLKGIHKQVGAGAGGRPVTACNSTES